MRFRRNRALRSKRGVLTTICHASWALGSEADHILQSGGSCPSCKERWASSTQGGLQVGRCHSWIPRSGPDLLNHSGSGSKGQEFEQTRLLVILMAPKYEKHWLGTQLLQEHPNWDREQ